MPDIDDEARARETWELLDVGVKCILGWMLIALVAMAILEWARV